MTVFQLWIEGFGATMIMLTTLWLVSVRLKNASIIDPFWGLGFVVLINYYLWRADNYTPATVLVAVLVTLWGLRLFTFLSWRNWGKGEDYRYQQFRADYGPHRYWWFSFFQVFLLQGALMSLVGFPLLAVAISPFGTLGVPHFVVAGIWLIGLFFESVGDLQLARFKASAPAKGQILNTGLWKYTRHPNYFGDAVVWWSFGLFAVLQGSLWGLIGPIIMTFLLLKVSGVSLLERTLQTTKPEYAAYARRTNAFFPWFPKKQ